MAQDPGILGDREPSSLGRNGLVSFGRQISDKFFDHLAEVIAVAIFASLAGFYFLFLAKLRVATVDLDNLHVTALSAVLAVFASVIVSAAVTGVFLTLRFRRIASALRLRIASMERESALEQTNEQKVRAAVEEAMASATQAGEDLSLVLVDIDNFRRLNNAYSYDIGTFVLRQFARLVSSNIRGARDRVMRYFERGDEFLVILPRTNLDDAYQGVAERLRKLVKGNRFLLSDGPEHRGEFCELSISAGVTAYLPGEHWKDVRGRMVTALHDAKAHGKDRCVLIGPDSAAATV